MLFSLIVSEENSTIQIFNKNFKFWKIQNFIIIKKKYVRNMKRVHGSPVLHALFFVVVVVGRGGNLWKTHHW